MSYGRWDRDRFERERGGREESERDYYDSQDYYERQREVDIREEEYRRPYAPPRERSRGPVMRESERIFFEDRERPTSGALAPYRRARDDYRYYDERETVVERDRDVVPYRREREDDREIDIKIRRGESDGPRPRFLRRQSSLDTHDRRPLPRYGDRIQEEIVVPAPPRRRSPPRYVERDYYEDIKVAEPDYYHDDDYHPYREREVETVRRRYPPAPQQEEIVYEKEEVIKSEYPKRGKTRMPRRLINIRAIMDLGYQFEEEEKTIVILKALGKDNIDEVIRISREYNNTPLPPPPLDQPVPPLEEEEEVVKRRTEIIRDNPSLASKTSTRDSGSSSSSSSRSSSPTVVSASTRKSRKSHKSHKTHKSSRSSRHTTVSSHRSSSHRSKSRHRRHRSTSFSSDRTARRLVIHDDYHSRHERPISTALVIPRSPGGQYLTIDEQLRSLELERKALQLERETKEVKRDHNNYLIESEYPDGTIELKPNRKGPDSRLLRAAMATLT